MTKQKSTKRALLMSALSLLLCVSMLIGSTFAWFTDSVTSGSNVITAGNLDIVVEYTLGDKDTEGNFVWKDLAGATDLFQKDLWEPGHTEVVVLRIKNNGTLALKYVANMNIIDEKIGKNKDGDDIVLSDILTVSTCTQQYTDGNGNVASGADIFPAMAFNGDGGVDGWIGYQATSTFKAGNVLKSNKQLQPKESDYIAVKVDMAEIVGNEANHNGKDIPSIEFGLNVFATQYTYEDDSFGNQYDELAGETHFMVNGVNYDSFDKAVANAAPDANGVVTYFISGNAVFSGGWNAPIAPAGTSKVVIKGTGAKTASLNLAHTYRNQLCATDMIVELSDITVDCDPCGTHQDQRNVWVTANEFYAKNVVFKDPADASNVRVAVFDSCVFASAGAAEEPSGGNYQLWVGDHDANYGSILESVTVKNCEFMTGKRAIKLAPTTGNASGIATFAAASTPSYTAVIDGNTFYDITYKPAVCLNYGDQANTVSITNNILYNTKLVEDEVNGNYTASNNKILADTTIDSADELRDVLNSGATDISLVLTQDIALDVMLVINAGSTVHLNMNGKTVNAGDAIDPESGFMWVNEGSSLTIDGNGIFDLGANPGLSFIVPKGEVVIENGTFIREVPAGTDPSKIGALFVGTKTGKVVIKDGYFDGGFYDKNAELAFNGGFTETDDDIAKRGNSGDKNIVRTALKNNIQKNLNLSADNVKVYGGTFVGVNPAWGDEGCMLPTTPDYLRPWSYYQGAFLEGQTFNENGIVLPDGYTVTKGTTADGIPTYTVEYSK